MYLHDLKRDYTGYLANAGLEDSEAVSSSPATLTAHVHTVWRVSDGPRSTRAEAGHRLSLLPLHVHGRDHRVLASVTSLKRVLRTSLL